MKRTDFIPIFSLAVVSACPDVENICLFRYDILHIYYADDSFDEVNVSGWENEDFLANVLPLIRRSRPVLDMDVKPIPRRVVKSSVEFRGKWFTDKRLNEHEGQEVLLAPYKGLLWIYEFNRKLMTTINME